MKSAKADVIKRLNKICDARQDAEVRYNYKCFINTITTKLYIIDVIHSLERIEVHYITELYIWLDKQNNKHIEVKHLSNSAVHKE